VNRFAPERHRSFISRAVLTIALPCVALLTALPPLFIYFVSGRYFVRGLMAGAVKG